MTIENSIQRFSKTVENYVKYRPTYPQALIDFLLGEGLLNDETVVADIGSGTGLLAQLFLENDYQVIGVEPNDHMRNAARQALKEYPLFSGVKGTAEATTLPDQSVDLITVGQAFHWFDPQATRQEFARLLKAGGWTVLAWNLPREDTPFQKACEALVQSYRKEANPHHFTKETAVDKIRAFFAPQPITMEVFDNYQVVDYAGLKGRVLSSSFAPEPDQPDYEVLLSELETLFQTYHQDNQVTIAYDCRVYLGQLT